jgi:hypothetical protein
MADDIDNMDFALPDDDNPSDTLPQSMQAMQLQESPPISPVQLAEFKKCDK